VGRELDRIEAAVASGDTDLAALGFWRIVARVKSDPTLVEAHADQMGRIDAAAFRARVRRRVGVATGNAAMLLLILGGGVALVLASRWEGIWAGLAVLGAVGAWAVGVHSPSHWLVGRWVGIRCTDYFLGGPPPPRPGIKTDYATYLRTPARARAWFHASGAIATKIVPLLVLAIAPLTHAPGWAVLGVLVIAVAQILTDVLFSTKTGDWKKVRREMAYARSA
jgi:hypothetical protein